MKDGVATFSSAIKGSKLIGVRGVTVLDMHISESMGPFVNVTMSYEWIDVLGHIESYPVDSNASSDLVKTKDTQTKRPKNPLEFVKKLLKDKRNSTPKQAPTPTSQDGYVPVDLIHQELRLPWPISPRDILLRREFDYYRPEKTTNNVAGAVTISYRSVTDSRIPLQKNFIRSEAPHVLWRFVLVPPGSNVCSVLSANGVNTESRITYGTNLPTLEDSKALALLDTLKSVTVQPCVVNRPRTVVVVECVVDSKGSIPTWFINFMQGSWPSKTLERYRRLTGRGRSERFHKVEQW